MQMNERTAELLINERRERFIEMKRSLAKAVNDLRSFAHDEDCGDEPTSCPALCCGDQLRILSAIVWDIADTIQSVSYALDLFMEADVSPESRLRALTKFTWQLRTLTSVFFFVNRAHNHEDHFYSTNFWFWNDLVELREQVYTIRWFHDRLLLEYGFHSL